MLLKVAEESTGEKQAESSRPQKGDKTVQSIEGQSANKQNKPLTDREHKIWEVIQRGAKGLQYCRELDKACIGPPRSGVWKNCPSRKYESAYREGVPWPHRIQDEEYKVRRKAERAGLANSPASKSIHLAKPA